MECTESSTGEGTSEELFALSTAIAAVVGGSVAIEDLDRRVLAYSTLPDQLIDDLRRQGILNRQVPDEPRQLSQYRAVLNTTGVRRLPPLAPDELPRAAVAIRAGDLPLGTIWAIEGSEGLTSASERALLDGARLAALHMLRRRSAAELDLHARQEALHGALNGNGSAAETRFRLGLSDQPQFSLLGLAPLRVAGRESPPVVRLGVSAAGHFAAVHTEAAVTTLGRTVYVLLPELSAPAVRRLAEQAVTALARSRDVPLRSAISRCDVDPGELPQLRTEVDDILRVTTTDPTAPPVASLEDAHARVLLAHIGDTLAREPRLRHPSIAAMLEHDREQRTSYGASVLAWLDAVGNIGQAADLLGCHPNTLKYRLKRVRELFGLDLNHPDDRLSCWLQLRLSR
ncbi:PucR family transcriptional regulator [Streptomyces rectiviolaceus]|uniref:Helix-turn-helix domain-containing protein n=1 Tax=Streptomyces rectiviolaceus TaxID=332591 RepID=A0ABP6MI70_9ACTN